ncbi:hypothetical protein, partial [Streptococcus pyogenes]|uniref:hypothetical protein n=1 Tax=Streptococcus pyogenes TaxID=1314 RepID=UPI0034D95BD9
IGPGRTQGGWVSESLAALPLSSMSRLNSRLLKSWVRRYTLRRGALLFGKLLPVGIGVVVGAVGNYLAGKKIIRNANRAFGAPPARWPRALHLVPPIHEAGVQPAPWADRRQKVSLYRAESMLTATSLGCSGTRDRQEGRLRGPALR